MERTAGGACVKRSRRIRVRCVHADETLRTRPPSRPAERACPRRGRAGAQAGAAYNHETSFGVGRRCLSRRRATRCACSENREMWGVCGPPKWCRHALLSRRRIRSQHSEQSGRQGCRFGSVSERSAPGRGRVPDDRSAFGALGQPSVCHAAMARDLPKRSTLQCCGGCFEL